MGQIFVQIGAGAGDCDSRANFRDGFSELVKSMDPRLIERVILVEPNPINITALRQCWKDYPQAEIYQIGINVPSLKNEKLTFYFADEDKPHYQVFSLKQEHVLKHYPNGTIRTIEVETQDLVGFLRDTVGTERQISLLSLDIEGIDAEILLSIDWRYVNVERLSFEHLHLAEKTDHVLRHLGNSGYMFIGSGVDVNGYDLMYERIRVPLTEN
jgi:FkbM family methyltransferase